MGNIKEIPRAVQYSSSRNNNRGIQSLHYHITLGARIHKVGIEIVILREYIINSYLCIHT